MAGRPPAYFSLRWPAGILLASIALVVVLDGGPTHHSHLVLVGSGKATRTAFFAGMSGTAGAVLGFFTATVAILVGLDPGISIVGQLRRGEAMTLLIVNILAGCLWLLVLAAMSVVGWLLPNTGGGVVFAFVYEVAGVAALGELLIGGIFFSIVTIKIARYD